MNGDKAAEAPGNDEQIRSFIAIELPETAKEGLARLRKELERDDDGFVRWVAPDGIHLTLKFLGNIPSKQVTAITEAVKGGTRGISPFHLEISGLGVFPNARQVRVFWVGVGGETDKLSRLQKNIDSALAALGFAREERPFVPHLTLARVREGASPMERKKFGELVSSTLFEDKYPIEVEAVKLIRSRLTSRGAIYSGLSVIRLGA
jgi:RNA 2',3'-cyclic 3'-phosphodiesterase